MTVTRIIRGAKGGVGNTTVATLLAQGASQRGRTLLIDTTGTGDCLSILGMPFSFTRATENGETIQALTNLDVAGKNYNGFGDDYDTVIIDAGTTNPTLGGLEITGHTTVVTTLCYLSLKNLMANDTPDEIIVLKEKGRALNVQDVESITNMKVYVVIPRDPAVARAIDAGMLTTRFSQFEGLGWVQSLLVAA